jgi:hypothetical protein
VQFETHLTLQPVPMLWQCPLWQVPQLQPHATCACGAGRGAAGAM